MQPYFSVIMPTFNRSYVVWKSILSLQLQTFYDWELIVVDDGSTDSTKRVIEEFQDNRIKYYYQDNGGPSKARNTGLKHSIGKYIAYLDSDNTYYSDFLKTFYLYSLNEPEIKIWYCGYNHTTYERNRRGKWGLVANRIKNKGQFSEEDIKDFNGTDTNTIVHKNTITNRIGGWDENCCWLEDWDFFVRLCLEYPNEYKYIAKILVDYRQVHGKGTDAICGSYRENIQKEMNASKYLFDKWKDHKSVDIRKFLYEKDKFSSEKARTNINMT